MIDKALASLFRVITEEAGRNPSFAAQLDEALGTYAEAHVLRRRREKRIADFHPVVEARKLDADAFAARLEGFDQGELRMIVERHNLDPGGRLKGRPSKRALTEHITAAARQRLERDAKLFEY